MNEFLADRTLFAWSIKLLGLAFATGLIAAYYSRVRAGAVHWLRRMEILVAVAAWGLLSWALFVRGNEFGRLPVSNIFEVFQSLGWSALFFVVFLRVVWNLRVPVFAGTGIAWGLCLMGNVNAKNWDSVLAPGTPLSGEPWIGVHAGLATVGYACFSAAAMMWFIYILQNSALRKRFSHPFFAKLPDLNSLDRIAGRLCSAGLVIFGTGVAVGIAALASAGNLESYFVVYKVGLSVVLLVGLLALLILRRSGKISALKCARWGLGVFLTALVLLGGSGCLKKTREDVPVASEVSSGISSSKTEGGMR